nr:MAG TPA: major tail protein [Caudoviricetes sp.]
MRYNQIPANTFKELMMNAAILATDFTPATGEIGESGLIGATSGGVNFTTTTSYKDFGEDIDNCPKNTMELKRIESIEVKCSGTFVSINKDLAKRLMASADADSTDTTKLIPRNELKTADFQTIWIIGDYSDKNSEENGGYVAIKLLNALSTGGFQIQTTDKEKGKFSFEFTGHYSIEAVNKVPYELYVKAGTDAA